MEWYLLLKHAWCHLWEPSGEFALKYCSKLYFLFQNSICKVCNILAAIGLVSGWVSASICVTQCEPRQVEWAYIECENGAVAMQVSQVNLFELGPIKVGPVQISLLDLLALPQHRSHIPKCKLVQLVRVYSIFLLFLICCVITYMYILFFRSLSGIKLEKTSKRILSKWDTSFHIIQWEEALPFSELCAELFYLICQLCH